MIQDLDELPLPRYDYYPRLDSRNSLPLEAGRGCPFACRFCSTNDFFRRKFRLKSAEKLVGEMVELAERYGVREFQLTHDMFTVDRKRVVAFCETLLGQDVALHWRCSARTDCVDPELLELMARAGCRGIFFGIETGSQRMQHIVDKNLDLCAARKILRAADTHGIHTTASLITGYPQEGGEDLDGTVNFFGEAIRLEHCDPQLHLLSPLAETPLATEYRDRLVYDRIASDISGERDYLDPVDELLVLSHPDIFPNFYALPCPIDRAYLQHLRSFLIGMAARAKGLLVALHSECGGLRSVYDGWRATCPVEPDATIYRTWGFFQDFLAFVERCYFGEGRIGVEVMTRFYSALEAQAHFCPPFLDDTEICLGRNMRLVRVKGDVIGVLAALRNSGGIGPALGDRVCMLGVEVSATGNNRILELPELAARVLDFCKHGASVPELAAHLKVLGAKSAVEEVIEILHRQELIELGPLINSRIACNRSSLTNLIASISKTVPSQSLPPVTPC